jgi:hypothetical protein
LPQAVESVMKIRFPGFSSFRQMPKSSKINMFWMPPHRGAGQAPQVRHDDQRTFYEFINLEL